MANKKDALFLVESQPPHLGELISVLSKIEEYGTIHICVSGISKVITVKRAMTMWLYLIEKCKFKATISALLVKFDAIPELPKQFQNCVVLTTSPKVYVHMTSLNVEAELVPRTLGYYDVFQRTAYRQGRALDYLLHVGARGAKYTPINNEE